MVTWIRWPAWMGQAACRTADPDMFFDKTGADEAKTVCRSCPVEHQCGTYARTEKIAHGVWGGMTPADRYPTRGRPRAVVVHGTYNGYRAHLYWGEQPCDECRRAAQDYDTWRYRRGLVDT